MEPRYQELVHSDIPIASSESNDVVVSVIAGKSMGIDAGNTRCNMISCIDKNAYSLFRCQDATQCNVYTRNNTYRLYSFCVYSFRKSIVWVYSDTRWTAFDACHFRWRYGMGLQLGTSFQVVTQDLNAHFILVAGTIVLILKVKRWVNLFVK